MADSVKIQFVDESENKTKILNFVVCNPCQSSVFLQFKGNFVPGENK